MDRILKVADFLFFGKLRGKGLTVCQLLDNLANIRSLILVLKLGMMMTMQYSPPHTTFYLPPKNCFGTDVVVLDTITCQTLLWGYMQGHLLKFGSPTKYSSEL